MKKLRTLSSAILAMTLITSALFAPFAFAHKSNGQVDLGPSSEAVAEDPGAASGPPYSIAMASSRDGNNEIYVMNPDGSSQTNKTNATSNDQRPDISPDGSQIVFASNRDGNFEIFIMNFDESDVRQLTFTAGPVNNSWPRWSPDGEWIAFHSGSGSNFQIYKIRPDGSDLTPVTNFGGLNQFPGWSPDGTRLAIRRGSDIYVINADGSNPIRLTNQGTINQMASWSPDGTQIAFMSDRAGYISIFIMNSDGSGQFNFTPKPDGYPGTWTSRAPAWSPNGQYIYFTAVRSVVSGNSEQIFVKSANVVESAETQLTSVGANFEATVRKIIAPTITSVSASPNILWPANNAMVPVTLTVGVTDNSDSAPVCLITNVETNEPSSEGDWHLTGLLTLDLRAQRLGTFAGRVYTITIACTNSSELSSSAELTVGVPHDQRR